MSLLMPKKVKFRKQPNSADASRVKLVAEAVWPSVILV